LPRSRWSFPRAFESHHVHFISEQNILRRVMPMMRQQQLDEDQGTDNSLLQKYGRVSGQNILCTARPGSPNMLH
jgi:hypothetical protein